MAEAGVEELAAPGAVPALQLSGITKSWGELKVLDDTDLAVSAGERVWIGGRNGVGKTTLLRIAAGLILPEAGEIRLGGLNPEKDRREFQKQIGFLSAGNTGLYARLSVRDNLDFWAGIAFVPRSRRAETIKSALAHFGLEELTRRRVDRLSMGQRQRVRLAGAFLHRPSVIFLDEPETSLDDDGLAALGRALGEHTAVGGSAVICSPSFQKLQFEVESAYVLDSGRLRPA